MADQAGGDLRVGLRAHCKMGAGMFKLWDVVRIGRGRLYMLGEIVAIKTTPEGDPQYDITDWSAHWGGRTQTHSEDHIQKASPKDVLQFHADKVEALSRRLEWEGHRSNPKIPPTLSIYVSTTVVVVAESAEDAAAILLEATGNPPKDAPRQIGVALPDVPRGILSGLPPQWNDNPIRNEILEQAFDLIDIWDWRDSLDNYRSWAQGHTTLLGTPLQPTKTDAMEQFICDLIWTTPDGATHEWEDPLSVESYLTLNRAGDRLWRDETATVFRLEMADARLA